MKPLLLLWITFLLSINRIPTYVHADNTRHAICKNTFSCGEITDLKFPFWGGGRSEYCGRPDLELSCQNGSPSFTINSVTYRILSFDSSTQTLRVARDDYYNTICPSEYKSTTLDPTVVRYNGGIVNMTLYYNCSAFVGRFTPCNITDDTSIVFYGSKVNYTDLCSNSVIIPISETSVEALMSNQISLQQALDDGFSLQWVVDSDKCNTCMSSNGECGYASEGQFSCFCKDGAHLTTCADGDIKEKAFFIAFVSVGAIVIIIGNIIKKKAKATQNDQHIVEFIRNQEALATKKYSYSDVKKMTNKFAYKLGQGGYGSVYRGKLLDGRDVAVKLLSESRENGQDFMNEIASISRTSHINIVSLLGFCYEGSNRVLIYEFLSNGSLDKFICNRGASNMENKLEWTTLYEIAIGIARGLEYLHRGCNMRILHFDIKPHNILLDDKFCPKISDFDLAKLCNRDKSAISLLDARGTIGYIAPEVFSRNFGRVSYKSDVYSYGIMVFEMVGARNGSDLGMSRTSNEKYFPNYIYKSLEAGHPLKVDGVTNEKEEKIFKKMVLVSLWCIQTNPSDRPTMTKVLEMLEGSLQSLPFPPLPFLSSPNRSPLKLDQNYSTTS